MSLDPQSTTRKKKKQIPLSLSLTKKYRKNSLLKRNDGKTKPKLLLILLNKTIGGIHMDSSRENIRDEETIENLKQD